MKRHDTRRKEFNKSDTKYTTRMKVFIGRKDLAPEAKLVSIFAVEEVWERKEEVGEVGVVNCCA